MESTHKCWSEIIPCGSRSTCNALQIDPHKLIPDHPKHKTIARARDSIAGAAAVHSGISWKIQDGGEQETTQGRRSNHVLFTPPIDNNHARRRDGGLNASLTCRKRALIARRGLVGVETSASRARWLGSLCVSKHEGGKAPAEAAGRYKWVWFEIGETACR